MTHRHSQLRRAFTLIELLVVMTIVIILAAVTVPAIKSLTKGNAQAQAVNQIRSELSYARSIAISQHREAGVVFFEQTAANVTPANPNQTAMQVFVEAYDQTVGGLYPAGTVAPGNTIFVQNSGDVQFLPVGVQVATLGTDFTGTMVLNTNDSAAGNAMRAVVFDSTGQMISRTKLATPDYTDAAHPEYKHYGDWRFFLPGDVKSPIATPASSGAFVVYNKNDYAAQTFASDSARTAWLQQHADILVVNAYTGNLIR